MAATRVQISGVTWIYKVFKEEANANVSIFQIAVWYLLLSPSPVSSHFLLKWFQFSAHVMLSEDRNGPAAFFQWSSIIHYNQNPSANPGNYWLQAASHVAGSRKHTHIHTHCAPPSDHVWCQESETHLHITRSATCSLTPPLLHLLLSQRCYLTHFGIIGNSNQLRSMWQEHNGT